MERLEYDFAGPIFKNALALGDVDNDGLHELVVANQNGDLAIFKGENTKSWRRAADLGMVTAIGIGDIFNQVPETLLRKKTTAPFPNLVAILFMNSCNNT